VGKKNLAYSEFMADIPSQAGKTAIVTGYGGIGYESALALAKKGASVILAGRNKDKGKAAIERISAIAPEANARFEQLDLADLSSIEACGKRLCSQLDSLDILINNAGVMTPPERRLTKDGFELQFGTNYLGHFAFTAHLMPLLKRASQPHVVCVSSFADKSGILQFEDLQFEKRYDANAAYAQSKLACLMFSLELNRRSLEKGWGIVANAAHPGIAATELITREKSMQMRIMRAIFKIFPFMRQSAADASLTSLKAAIAPDGGKYYGPGGRFELSGSPKIVEIPKQAQDTEASARLWEVSEKLANVAIK
jgi:NAD(P)-dependent dehydrogenase (short-subunit alcohol dehydrogenase family)